MNKEEIYEIIERYEKVIKLARQKIDFIQKIDAKRYWTGNYIENIEIEDFDVLVRFDTSCRGSCESESFCFPLSWLYTSDEELEQIVIEQKKKREEEDKKRKEALIKHQEEKEIKMLLELKAKYENR